MTNTLQEHGYSGLVNGFEKQQQRQRRSELLEFDSNAHNDIEKHGYSPLPPERNRIRLLRLFAGVLDSPLIDCEMFEAEFDGHGILRHIGDDGPTSGRLKDILNRASIKDILKDLKELSDDSINSRSQQNQLPENDTKPFQKRAKGTPQGNTDKQPLHNNKDPSQNAFKGPLQEDGIHTFQNDVTSQSQSEPDSLLSPSSRDHSPSEGIDNSMPVDSAPNRKLEKYLKGKKLVDFPVLGEVLKDTITPDLDSTRAQDSDVLDRTELMKVLERTTLKDIIDISKFAEVQREIAQGRDPRLQRVLNGVKLDEILKAARLGNEIEYEALSWRWGDEDNGKYAMMIKKNGNLFKKRVSQTLGLALKYLRLIKDRIIWIDAICIDQKNLKERSFQVALMSLVYTGAKEICVWLGEDDDDSTKAIKFVKDEISQLKDFDKLCTDRQHSPKWKSLLVLMQRAWFSRRWVVQEIALASKAQVYCGPDQISWVDLAIAVELFVEVETATHRLSELMKKDEVVPYWFEHVSELGASVLVSATARVFREHRGGGYGALTSTKETNSLAKDFSNKDEFLKKGLLRRSLLSLEYLVTSLSIFDCGRPHDSIYALIAIARDAAPHPPSSLTRRTNEALVVEVFSDALEQKPYPLDYHSPYLDVCKEFVRFCINGAARADKVQALDILCRPWAKDWRPHEYAPLPASEDKEEKERILKHEGGWRREKKGEKEEEKKEEETKEEGKKEEGKKEEGKKEEGKKEEGKKKEVKLVVDHRDMQQYFADAKREFEPYEDGAGKKINKSSPYVPTSQLWFPATKKGNDSGGSTVGEPDEGKQFAPQKIDDLCLPSWVATIAGAAFDIFPHPGMDMVKMGRKNADPLVGVPQDGRRNYNACQLIGVDVKDVEFRRRARLGHYSLYVKGFCFDRVERVSHVSQAGAIPSAWLDLADWSKARRMRGPFDDPGDPPNDFWRTLVADRGMHNQNPPYYYMRACKETIMKGGLRSNAVDTSALIYNERNSIVAEFCRRVQAVIWNRALIRTKKGKLGLASEDVKVGDWVCLIYGCTVPVILRKNEKLKTEQEYLREKYEDRIEALTRSIHKAAKRRFRKARYEELQKEKAGWGDDVKAKLEAYKNDMNKSEVNEPQANEPKANEPKANEPKANEPEANDTDKRATSEGNECPNIPKKDTESEEEMSEAEEEGDVEIAKKRKQRQTQAISHDPFRHYKFIGEAYIHGMMDGEAVRQKFYKGKPDHTFELR